VAGPHGGCPARARGRTVVRASIVVGEVQRHGDRGGRSAGGRSWSRGGAVGVEGGALEEEKRGGGRGAPPPAAPLPLLLLWVVVLLGDGLLELEPRGLQRRRLLLVVAAPAPRRTVRFSRLRPWETTCSDRTVSVNAFAICKKRAVEFEQAIRILRSCKVWDA
jgi:hypothetical protein